MIDIEAPDYTKTPVSGEQPIYKYNPVSVEEKPILSIITPYYNTGEIFLETARCILGQSFQQWEWVIVNDGSTRSEALDVLIPFRAMDPRIRVIDQENRGLAGARNTGIRHSSAPYIFFLDSDDLLEPTALEYLLWKVYADSRVSFATSYLVGFGAQNYIWKNGFNTTDRFLDENMVSVMAVVRRSVVELAGMFDEKREIATEDYDFWLRCASMGFWGADVPLPLLWYRRRPANKNGDIRDQAARYEAFRQEMRTTYADLYAQGIPYRLVDDPSADTALHPIDLTTPFDNRLVRPDGTRRMLMLVPWMSLGGADKFNMDLISQLQGRGWQITVASTLTDEASWQHAFSRHTSDIFVLPRFLRRVDYPRFLLYLIRSRQIDTVLIANSALGYYLLPALQAACPHVTFLDYLHMEEVHWKNGGYPRLSITYQPFLDCTVVSSQHLRTWMAEQGGHADRIEVSTTNINTEDWSCTRFDRSNLRRAYQIDEDQTVVLYAGRLTAQKQPRIFAAVIRQLYRSHPSFVTLVAGDGPDRIWLERYVAEHDLKNVRLIGSVSQPRIRELLALSDIFFLPSEMEGISLAIYEAMAMELAIVGAKVGGQAELVTPECGKLVERGPNEVEDYVEILDRLLRDQSLVRQMGIASRRHVQAHYAIDQMGDRMQELLLQAQRYAANRGGAAADIARATALAATALEYIRIERAFDYLWMYQHSSQQQTLTLDRQRIDLQLWNIRKALWPTYHWAVTHGFGWLVPLKRSIARVYRSGLRLFGG